MNWFTKGEPEATSTGLITRLQDQEVAAAREYLQRFLDNGAVTDVRILQALAVLLLDLDKAGHL